MKAKLTGWFLDGILASGSCVFSYGFWLAWHPLGFIVQGALLSAFAVFCSYGRLARK